MSENEEKRWTAEDIDRLLKRTDSTYSTGDSVVEKFARTIRLADSVPEKAFDAEQQSRVEPLEQQEYFEEPTRQIEIKGVHDTQTGDIGISTRTAKQRVADILNGIKSNGENPSKDETDFDEPLLPVKEHSMEYDENRRRFLEVMTVRDEEDEEQDSTKVIERPGFVVKRGKVDETEDLEEAPKIVDADTAKFDRELFRERVTEDGAWSDGQMMLSGFENQEEMPVVISEAEAERKVRKNRSEMVKKFRLMDIAEAENVNTSQNREIEKLFKPQNENSKEKQKRERVNNAGVEYKDEKDANRIRGTLNKLKKTSFLKVVVFSVITLTLLLLNIISCVTARYDIRLVQILNLTLLVFCIIIDISEINSGIITLFKRKPDMKSAVAFASLAALVQNICALVGEAAMDYHSFAISGCAAAMFAMNEYGAYLRHARTYDGFNFCTGSLKDKLYSVQEVEDKNEEFEIGRNLLMESPDVRYSCKAKFPKRLIEQCESDVSSDKLQSLLLPLAAGVSLLCGVFGGLATKDLFYGVTAWAGAMCVCVPAFGTASIQLPLRWANKRLNKAGGVITGQKAAEEYSKTNSIILDSKELFDIKNCRMHGFKDFKRVRIDDIMLYSAAMVIRSGGPLAEVFDQVVSRRDLLPEVSSFNYEDRMGISGWINGQKVIMGNRSMMEHHNFQIDEDEQKYTHDGRKVIYLAIANSLCAMLVVSYAPNKKLAPYIKRLGRDGVTILLRNNDSNITTDMINQTFGVRFTNIRMMNNTGGRLFKKYRNRVREYAKSGIIHDGSAYSFMRSFTMSYTICGTFKAENLIQLFNVIAGAAAVAGFAVLKVFSVTGMWPLLLFQLVMFGISILIARLRGVF